MTTLARTFRLPSILLVALLPLPLFADEGGRSTPGPVATLVRDLDHESFETQEQAVGRLVRMGRGAVPALIRALAHGSWKVRWRACQALGRIGAPAAGALGALARVTRNSTYDRYEARRAITAIEKTLKGPARPDRHHGARPSRKASPPPPGSSRTAGQALPSAEVSRLIGALGSRNWRARRDAARQLGRLGPDAVAAIDALVRSLADRAHQVGVAVQDALARIGARAVGALTEALDHRHHRVRERAGRALAAIGEPALDELIRVVQGLRVRLRRHACAVLGSMAGRARRAAPVLARLLRDRRWPRDDRRGLLKALQSLGDPRSIPDLLAHAHKVQFASKGELVTALASYGKEAIEPVMKALRGEIRAHGRMTEAVYVYQDVLVRIGKPVFPVMIREMAGRSLLRLVAVTVMTYSGKKAIPELTRALRHPSRQVRHYARSALEGIARSSWEKKVREQIAGILARHPR